VSVWDEGGADDDDEVVFDEVGFLVGLGVVSETETDFRFPPSSSLTSVWDPFSAVVSDTEVNFRLPPSSSLTFSCDPLSPVSPRPPETLDNDAEVLGGVLFKVDDFLLGADGVGVVFNIEAAALGFRLRRSTSRAFFCCSFSLLSSRTATAFTDSFGCHFPRFVDPRVDGPSSIVR